jgi:hypothetical protein
LQNIISGVGIQSSSTRIGTGFTDINFIGAGITVTGIGNTVNIFLPPPKLALIFIEPRVGAAITITAYVGILTVFGRTADTQILV